MKRVLVLGAGLVSRPLMRYLLRQTEYRLLVASDEVKRMVQKRTPVEQLRQQAIQEGMTTLLQDGIQKVLGGHTDFKQVRAVCIK